MKLLLFDIDGTLVRVNDTGRTAMTGTLSRLAGRPISTEAISFSGRTDPDILRAVLAENDLPTSDEAVTTAIHAYVETMKKVLSPEQVEALPGVRSLVSTLSEEPNVQLGLLTGNVEPIAYEKLSACGLDAHFPFGAFGSDHTDRNELASVALRRASVHTGHAFESGEQAIVVGDTVHDIECARAVGAEVVAVCTGRHDRNDLAAHAPDVLLDSLQDTNGFLERVCAD